MEASNARPSLATDHRLSPRCLLNGSTSSLSSCFTSRSPFGLSRQPSVSSGVVQHGRQSSSTSAELCQYLPSMSSHSRQNSASNMSGAEKSPPIIPPRRPYVMTSPSGSNPIVVTPPTLLKLSPNSIDMGYHTMVTSNESPPPPPFREPPPPAPPGQLIRMDSKKLRVSYKKLHNGNTCKFSDLGDELLLRILSFLPKNVLCQCARVSRRLYFLVWEPVLWSSIELSVKNCDEALTCLMRHLSRDRTSQNVLKICLTNSSGFSDRGLEIIGQTCPHLKHLEVKNCKRVTNLALQQLMLKCKALSHLELSGCSSISTISLPGDALSEERGVALASSFNLQFLDLTDCVRLMDAGLHLIAKNSPHLRQLYLRRCINISDLGIKYLTSYCLHLRELSISDCCQITDFGLYELAKLGPNLRYLSVAKCDQISDAGVKEIARLCYKLRYLNVRGCEAVSDDAIEVISESCHRLKSLDIGKCDVTDVGLKLLSQRCSTLRKLSLKSCEMISDSGLQSVAYYCRDLQQLNIQDCPLTLESYRMVKKFCKQCIIEHTNPGFY